MLEFINNNGVLFSGIFSLISICITTVISIIRDYSKYRNKTIHLLEEKLAEKAEVIEKLKDELNNARSIEFAEKNIDKTHGAIYKELLENGEQRDICGYCWEKDHIKIPLEVSTRYNEYTNEEYYDGFCKMCKTHCIENIYPENYNNPLDGENDESSNNVDIEDLPF